MKQWPLVMSATAFDLGLFRASFFCVFLYNQLTINLPGYLNMPYEFWEPWGFFELLNIPLFSVSTLNFFNNVLSISLLFAAIGLYTRISCLVSFVLSFYLIGMRYNFGSVHSYDALPVIVCGVLMLSNCAGAVSVDRFLSEDGGNQVQNNLAYAYSWPFWVIRFLFIWIFFSAGYSKLNSSGIGWISNEYVPYYISVLKSKGAYGGIELLGVDLILNSKFLMQAGLAFTLFLELFSPLALFSRLGAVLIIPGLLLLQLIFMIVIKENFLWFFAPMYLVWVSWSILRFLPMRLAQQNCDADVRT